MLKPIPKKIEKIMIKKYDRDNVQCKRTKFYSYLTKVKVNKKKWTAYSDENISKGTKVKILSVSGVKLKVETHK